jgi:hypothetical protein
MKKVKQIVFKKANGTLASGGSFSKLVSINFSSK